MEPFDHVTPESLPETLALMMRLGGKGRVIAGGTDLVLNMRNGVVAPNTVINIKRLKELKGIAYDKQHGLRIGALTTLREITRSPHIQEHYQALSQAASQMASEQIRSFATVGGNLCNGSPSADQAPPLIAMKAEAHITSLKGDRALPLEDFFIGPGETILQPHELLLDIKVPPPKGSTIFIKHTPRKYMDISVVCIAINLILRDRICDVARIVLGAVAPVPIRAREAEAILVGQAITEERIEQAATAASAESKPIDDEKSSAWYRRHIVKVLVHRGLNALVENRFDEKTH